MKQSTHSLHTLTNRLLDAAPDDYAVLLKTTTELYELLVKNTALDTDANANRDNNHLQSGKAIGATWAAMCIRDLLRTKKFMDGLYHAVIYLQQKNPGKKIHILYAGTGPFATLMLPLAARFGSDALQFTLLEVNKESYEFLQRTIASFQLQDYVHDIQHADATSWHVDNNMPVNILLSETMQHALVNEPQVAIVMHLLPQLPPECLLIPEKIMLEATLVNTSRRTAAKMAKMIADDEIMHTLGEVFELSGEAVMQASPVDVCHHSFPPVTLDIPPGIVGDFPTLCIETTIQVFQTDILLPDQCALTLPLVLDNLSSKSGIREITFNYVIGAKPGLRYSVA